MCIVLFFSFQCWLLATTPLTGGNHTGLSKIPGGLTGGLMGKRPPWPSYIQQLVGVALSIISCNSETFQLSCIYVYSLVTVCIILLFGENY